MKFNIALLSPIVGTLGALGLWFAWLHAVTKPGVLYVALFLQLVGLLIIVLPDKTDTQTDKDASNWRSWSPVILAILGTFGFALYTHL